MSEIAGLKPDTRDRTSIPQHFKWDLDHIFADLDAWEAGLGTLEQLMDRYGDFKGTLADGPDQSSTRPPLGTNPNCC